MERLFQDLKPETQIVGNRFPQTLKKPCHVTPSWLAPNKHPGWKPAFPYAGDADLWRGANGVADSAATEALSAAIRPVLPFMRARDKRQERIDKKLLYVADVGFHFAKDQGFLDSCDDN